MSNSRSPSHSSGKSFDTDWYNTPAGMQEQGHLDLGEEEGEGNYTDLHGGSWYDDGPEEEEEGHLSIRVSDFVHNAFLIPNEEGDFDKFSFRGRNHLISIYDSSAQDILLKCARQVEKCVSVKTILETKRGPIPAIEAVVGDEIACMDKTVQKITWGRITWKSKIVDKPIVRIKTRSGRVLDAGEDHPVRLYGRWVEAKHLKVGDVVMTAEYLPEDAKSYEEETVYSTILTAFALCCTDNTSVAVRHSSTLELLKEVLTKQGASWDQVIRTPSAAPTLHVYRKGLLGSWLGGIQRKGEIPRQIFESGVEMIRLFLRIYWSLNGSVYLRKHTRGATFTAQTGSTSRTLIRQLHSLHLRAGILTAQRSQVPSYYRSRKQADGQKVEAKEWHSLSVVGRGRQTFFQLLVPEQREGIQEAPTDAAIFSYDRLPEEVASGLLDIQRQRKARWRSQEKRGVLWRKIQPRNGERITRAHARNLLDWLAADPVYDATRIESLREEVEGNGCWEDIVAIEKLGAAPCVDFTVDETHSILADGIVTHNSTFLGNMAITYCALIPGYKVLYVSPTNSQTRTFSADRLKQPIESSPLLRSFAEGGGTQNVMEKSFVNFSKIVLRSAYRSADRCRGIASYMLDLDELQDLLAEHLPVIFPCTSHSPAKYRRHILSGTPKSFDNNIEYWWSGHNSTRPMSTMGEWMVPCDACGSSAGAGRFWQTLSEENIQKKGLSCTRCGKLLNPQHEDAQWFHHQSDGLYEGYRISQLMVPWRSWPDILSDYATFPRAKFYNEVLGLSMDTYDRPLSMAEVRECCDPRIKLSSANRFRRPNWSEPIYAGIDWGLGTLSYTVMTLSTYIGGLYTTFWMKRFTGTLIDVQEQIDYVLETLREFNVSLVGTDFGFGVQNNDLLIRKFGAEKVCVFQHMGKLKKKVEYDTKLYPPRFKVYRTMVMADLINGIKRKVFRFMRWEDMREPFAQDFCNIVSEYSEKTGLMVYNHRPDRPDDSFHAWLYGFLASTMDVKRPDILRPMHDRYRQGPVQSTGGIISQG